MTDIEALDENVESEDFQIPEGLDPRVPLIAGTVAIYPDGKGGLVMVFLPDGAEEPIRKRIPAGLLKMMSGGPVGGSLRSIFGGK